MLITAATAAVTSGRVRLSVLHRSERGSALVELAVTLPLLVLLVVGVADLARVFYVSMALTNAARAGAQYGSSETKIHRLGQHEDDGGICVRAPFR